MNLEVEALGQLKASDSCDYVSNSALIQLDYTLNKLAPLIYKMAR
jgi:hypothetical protein